MEEIAEGGFPPLPAKIEIEGGKGQSGGREPLSDQPYSHHFKMVRGTVHSIARWGGSQGEGERHR